MRLSAKARRRLALRAPRVLRWMSWHPDRPAQRASRPRRIL